MDSHQKSLTEFLRSHNMLEEYKPHLGICQEREISLDDIKDMSIEELEILGLPDPRLTRLYLLLHDLMNAKVQQLLDFMVENHLLGTFRSLLVICAEKNFGIPDLMQNTPLQTQRLLNYRNINDIEALQKEINSSSTPLRRFLQARIDTSSANYAKFLNECESNRILLDELVSWERKKFLEKKYLKMTEVNELTRIFLEYNPGNSLRKSQEPSELKRSKTKQDEMKKSSTISLESQRYQRSTSDFLDNSLEDDLIRPMKKSNWLEESLNGKDSQNAFQILRLEERGEDAGKLSFDEEEYLEFVSLVRAKAVNQIAKRKYSVDFDLLDSTTVRLIGITGRSKLIDNYLVSQYQTNLDQLSFKEHNQMEIGLYVHPIIEKDKTLTILVILWPGGTDKLLDNFHESKIYSDFARFFRALGSDCLIFLNSADGAKLESQVQVYSELQKSNVQNSEDTLEVVSVKYSKNLKETTKNPIKESRICGVDLLTSLFMRTQIEGVYKEEEKNLELSKAEISSLLKEKASRARVVIDPKLTDPRVIELLIKVFCPALHIKLDKELAQQEDIEEQFLKQRKKIIENYRLQQTIKLLKSRYESVAREIEEYLLNIHDFNGITADQWKKPELLTDGLTNLDLKTDELPFAELDKYKKMRLSPYEIAAAYLALDLQGKQEFLSMGIDTTDEANKVANNLLKQLGGCSYDGYSAREGLEIRSSEILEELGVEVKHNTSEIIIHSYTLFDDLAGLIAQATSKKIDSNREYIDTLALKKLNSDYQASSLKRNTQSIYEKYFKEMLNEMTNAPKIFENEVRIVNISAVDSGLKFKLKIIQKERVLREEWNHFRLASSDVKDLNAFPDKYTTMELEEDMAKTTLHPIEDKVLMLLNSSILGGKTNIFIFNANTQDSREESLPFESMLSDYDPKQKLLAVYYVSVLGAQLILYPVEGMSLGPAKFAINLTEDYNIIDCQFLCFEYGHSALWVLDDMMTLRKINIGQREQSNFSKVSMSLPKNTFFDCMTVTSDGEYILLLGTEGMLVYSTNSLQKVKHLSEIKGKSLQVRCLRVRAEKAKHYQLLVLDAINSRIESYELKIDSKIHNNNYENGLAGLITPRTENFGESSKAVPSSFDSFLKEFLPNGLKPKSTADRLYLIFSDGEEEESKSDYNGSNNRSKLAAYLRGALVSKGIEKSELDEALKRIVIKCNPNNSIIEEFRTLGLQNQLGLWLQRFLIYKRTQGVEIFSTKRPLLHFELQTKLSNSIISNISH